MSLPKRSGRARPWLLPLVAVLVLLYLWLDIWIGVQWLPTWAYLGSVTLPWSVFPPMLLSVVFLWHLAHSLTRSWFQYGLAVLAILTLLGGIYAIVVLNVAKPGVFFAAVFPVGFGFLLAVSILLGAGLRFRSAIGESSVE